MHQSAYMRQPTRLSTARQREILLSCPPIPSRVAPDSTKAGGRGPQAYRRASPQLPQALAPGKLGTPQWGQFMVTPRAPMAFTSPKSAMGM